MFTCLPVPSTGSETGRGQFADVLIVPEFLSIRIDVRRLNWEWSTQNQSMLACQKLSQLLVDAPHPESFLHQINLQAITKWQEDGAKLADRPVNVNDLFASSATLYT